MMISEKALYIKEQMRKSNFWNQPILEIRSMLHEFSADAAIATGVSESSLSLNGVNGYYYSAKGHVKPLKNLDDSILIYVHGGGNALDITRRTRAFASHLAISSGMDLFLVDFRLSPEHVFPAAHEDIMAVVKALNGMGITSDQLAFIGDSAGCGLILSTMQALLEHRMHPGNFAVFLCPMLDMTGSGESHSTLKGKDPFAMADPLALSRVYAGETPLNHPALSPLHQPMAGLPPVLVHGAMEDVFFSDAANFSALAASNGVDVTFIAFEELWHVFHLQYDMISEAKAALDQVGSWIREYNGKQRLR